MGSEPFMTIPAVFLDLLQEDPAAALDNLLGKTRGQLAEQRA